jgi:uncharacterized protein YaiL (DUF2058 family)
MSDFMKSIVEEVLNKQGSGTSQSTQAIQTQTEKKPSVSNTQHKKEVQHSKASISGLNRPNYQKMKKEKRLSGLEQTSTLSKPKHAQTSSSPDSDGLNKEVLSKLSTISLVQGKVEKQVSGNSAQRHKINKSPKLVGKTKDSSYVWFFPSVSDQLAQKFKRSPNIGSVGVITSKLCLPSQLLIVNDVMRENPDVKYHLTWHKNSQEQFVWELYDQDEARLEKRLTSILQILHRKSSKVMDSYTVMSPSAWLSKQLNITTSVEAVSVLEGVPYYASLLLLEQYIGTGEQKSFHYEIEENYLILCGEHNVISKVIQDFRRKAENLL